jgi:uncharacterized protein YecE (DUF72 family)
MPDSTAPIVRIGTAGWSLPRAVQQTFPGEGSHLERYSRVFPAAEINSSFYRPHKPAVYARWGASTPDSFRFSVKIPKAISHVAKLVDPEAMLDAFLGEASALGERLECLLVQLAPSLQLDERIATRFFEAVRARWGGDLVVEPRHATWFGAEAGKILEGHRVGRVAADPPRVTGGENPGGWSGVAYYRLHGSPRTYYSSYDQSYLTELAARLMAHHRSGVRTWCIFDNTASGAAAANALELARLLATRS